MVKSSGILWMECMKYEGEAYAFNYRDWQYKNIFEYKSFMIVGDESHNELYEILISTLQKKEQKKIEIDLGEGKTLALKFKGKTMEFWVWNGVDWSYSCPMNIKGINWLFGKSKK